ncbi:MAG: hypothetical protein WEE64_14620, partial [Dehalococcoidia bacterium]
GVHFEPAGFTDNPDLPQASSLVDYIFRWLERRFLDEGRGSLRFARGQARVTGRGAKGKGSAKRAGGARPGSGVLVPGSSDDVSTGLACPDCGSVVVFAEGCLVCRSCGYTKCG